MTRDYILGFMTCALLVCAVIIWLLWLGSDDPTPDDSARQGVPGAPWNDLTDDEREKLRKAAGQ